MSRRVVDIDPSVAAILGEAEDRAAVRRARGRKRREPAVRRQSVTLELNAGLVPMIREIAEGMGISPAGVVDRLLFEALRGWVAEGFDFEGFLEGSRSPRYDWIVLLPEAELRELGAQVARLVAENGNGGF